MTDTRPVVTFIQPYVPEYRVRLFDELESLLAAQGHRLAVVHGEPSEGQAARQDARLGRWSVPIRTRELHWRGRALRYRPVLKLARSSALVVAELASTNIDTYLLAADPRVSLMLWGHGSAYVTATSATDARLELWLARRAQRVFVYTEGGGDYLKAHGYEASRLTVVHNSTDTRSLRAAAEAVTDAEVASFRQRLRLGSGPVISFVGAYDDSKCLPLLIEAADVLHQQRPDVQVLLAGAGPLQSLVDDAASSRSFVHSLPRTDQHALAVMGRTSSFFVIPGRVGLVAVDALALGLPVITTSFPRHAPELEYLDDRVKFVADRSGTALAGAISKLLASPETLKSAQDTARRIGQSLSIEAMAAAFSENLFPSPLR